MEIITLYELNFTTFDEQLYYMNKSGGRKIIWRACNGNDNAVRAYKRNIDQLNIQPITAREINAAF